MKTTNFITLSCAVSFASLTGMAKEIVLSPGQLPGEIAAVKVSDDNTLVLKGTATPFDLTSLHALPSHVTTLDLSGLTIRGGSALGGEWFGRTEFADGELPAYMLLGTNVSTLTLPSSVSAIGAGAFSGTPLKEFSVNGVQTIGESVFYDCRQLRKVDFQNASFKEVPARLFSGCVSLEDIHIPHTVTAVGSRAFERCRVSVLFLPYVMEMGDYACSYATELNEIRFGQGCRMGEGVFYGAGALASLPCDAGNIPELYSAGGNGMEVITIKGSEVGEGAFSCSAASVIAFSSEVAKVGPYAFHSMPNLQKVVVEGCVDIPDADLTAFDSNDVSKVLLHVGRGNTERWRTAPVWWDFNITEEDSGVAETLMPGADAQTVRIELRGDIISVASVAPIQEVALYSVAGETLALSGPSSSSFEIPYPDGQVVVIVKAVAGREVNVVKLSR